MRTPLAFLGSAALLIATASGCVDTDVADDEPALAETEAEVVAGGFAARFDDTVRGGGVVVAGDTMAGRSILLAQGAAEINLTGIPAGAVVDRALLYWAISGGTDTTLLFEGNVVTGAEIALGGDTCWNTTNHVFRADVTARVGGNGNYDIVGLPSSILFSGVDTDGVALVVTYRQPTSGVRRRVVIRDGAITTNEAGDIATDTFPSLAAPLASTARLHMVVGDGQSSSDGAFTFGATSLGTNQWQGGEGSLWDTQTYDVAITTGQASATWSAVQGDDCILFVASALEFDVGVCGDGVLTGGETCDDGDADSLDGCSSFCLVEAGWTCDGTPSVCTTTCGDGVIAGAEACDDGDADAGDGCSATCTIEPGYGCTGMPSACTTTCGDGIPDGAEACDDGDTDAGDGCSATCTVEPGFMCAGTPSVCTATCGDGIPAGGEACDDGDNDNGDGCSATCTIEPGFSCTGTPSVCTTACGDGVIAGSEACDDANTDDGDGCDAACAIEPGHSCVGEPSTCTMSCGDGVIDPGEVCDDGGLTNGDGCSDICMVEPGHTCEGEPSTCAAVCGDGMIVGDETCDDGNTTADDGCDAACAIEPGFTCTGEPSACATTCGDGVRAGTEACDDGNLDGDDGCDAVCVAEPGYLCDDTGTCEKLVVAGGGCAASGGSQGGLAALAMIALAALLGRRRRAPVAIAALLVVTAAASRDAAAQLDDGSSAYSAERFQLAVDRDGILSVESARTPGHLSIDLGLWLGYADDPLTVRAGSDGERLAALVSHRLGGALVASIGLGTRFEVGLGFPLILSQDQELGDLMSTDAMSSFGLGDLQLMPKVALLRGQVDVALAARLTAPTSSADDYTGEDGLTAAPMLVLGATAGELRFGANLGYRIRGNTQTLGLSVADELFVDLGAAYRLAPSVEALASLALATPASSPFGDFNGNFTEGRLGVGIDVTDRVQLFGAGGVGLAEGWGTADWRALAGLWIGARREAEVAPAPRVVDRDGDGILDDRDACPDQPEVVNGFEDEDGCPDEDPDADRDGILIPTDQCPAEMETVNRFQDDDGCPDTVPDTDGDGLDDLVDQCIDSPEDFDGFQDDDGCPEADNDSDGVTDAADRCPLEAGPVENGGCPDTDRDGDTVVDRLDNCPDEPGKVANHGCKDKQLVVFDGSKITLLDVVYFKVNKDILEKRSSKLLNNVAAVLKAHPEVTKVIVEGHTDDQGDDAYNQDLSQRRAQAVVDFLVAAGIAADKLAPIGYGETLPIQAGKTKRARAANRRVEFKLEGIAGVQVVPSGPSSDTIEP